MADMQACENCSATIGKLEAPHVWQDHIVCAACYARLSQSPALGLPTPLPPPPPTFEQVSREIQWQDATKKKVHPLRMAGGITFLIGIAMALMANVELGNLISVAGLVLWIVGVVSGNK